LGVRLTTSHTIKTKLFRNQTVSLGIEKNVGRLFRRPELPLNCRAEGKEGREYNFIRFLVNRETRNKRLIDPMNLLSVTAMQVLLEYLFRFSRLVWMPDCNT
jgi:hypothetical protein